MTSGFAEKNSQPGYGRAALVSGELAEKIAQSVAANRRGYYQSTTWWVATSRNFGRVGTDQHLLSLLPRLSTSFTALAASDSHSLEISKVAVCSAHQTNIWRSVCARSSMYRPLAVSNTLIGCRIRRRQQPQGPRSQVSASQSSPRYTICAYVAYVAITNTRAWHFTSHQDTIAVTTSTNTTSTTTALAQQ